MSPRAHFSSRLHLPRPCLRPPPPPWPSTHLFARARHSPLRPHQILTFLLAHDTHLLAPARYSPPRKPTARDSPDRSPTRMPAHPFPPPFSHAHCHLLSSTPIAHLLLPRLHLRRQPSLCIILTSSAAPPPHPHPILTSSHHLLSRAILTYSSAATNAH